MAITNIVDLYISHQEKNDEYYAFYVNQGDYQSRTVQANLYITLEKGKIATDYNLSDEIVSVLYEYTDENGELLNTVEFECAKLTSIGSNVVSFVIPNIVLENSGDVKAQIRIYEDESTLLNTALFKFCTSVSLPLGTYEDNQIPLLVLITSMGEYDSSTEYQQGYTVTYNGNSYMYLNSIASVGKFPTDTQYWMLMASKGDTGDTGDTGDQGIQGEDGLSAYDVAVENGFVGTEAEWLASIQSANNLDGGSASTVYSVLNDIDGGGA